MSTAISPADRTSACFRNDNWPVAMRWQNLLFAHWPMAPEKLRPLLPPKLELDTYDGCAWIGIVPFHLAIRYRWIPFALQCPEVNVRTYARCRGQSGVWFLSLDASSRLAVTLARSRYCLPYHTAAMSLEVDRQSSSRWIRFFSRRKAPPDVHTALEVEYGPVGAPFHAEPGSLAHWLTERYTLFAVNRRREIVSADVEHVPWPLCRAEAVWKTNTMLHPLGLIERTPPPVLHFSHDLNVAASSLQ